MERNINRRPTSIIPLIEQWEIFTSFSKEKDLKSFAEWLLEQDEDKSKNRTGDAEKNKKRNVTAQKKLNNSATAAIFVTRLQRYISLYTKPYIKKLGFTKQHEYTFLHQISKMGSTNKKELSKENLTELSTGRDVVRRLIARGLVSEKINPDDKRATILGITEKGKKLLTKSHEMIGHSFGNFLGDLSAEEQQQLINLLKKLNNYHAKETEVEVLVHL
jgi:DNA-binding MarR family transcriptional regulator